MTIETLPRDAVDRFAGSSIEGIQPGQRSAPRQETQSSVVDRQNVGLDDRIAVFVERQEGLIEGPGRSSTALAKRAMAAYVARDSSRAVALAAACIEECVQVATTEPLFDGASCHIAATLLLSLSAEERLIDSLSGKFLPAALLLDLAMAESAMGRRARALAILDSTDAAETAAMKGFLMVAVGRPQQAIPMLRRALQRQPHDADSVINLAIALWKCGAKEKAVRMALRATRLAPGRQDISDRYMKFLSGVQDFAALKNELKRMRRAGIVENAATLIANAKVALTDRETRRAIRSLAEASRLVSAGDRSATVGEVESNLAALRFDAGEISREKAFELVAQLIKEHPRDDSILMNLAYLASRSAHAQLVGEALGSIRDELQAERRLYVEASIDYLRGEITSASAAVEEWVSLAPNDLVACSSYLLLAGIGMGRFEEALAVGVGALEKHPGNLGIINNTAYLLVMTGRAAAAADLLKGVDDVQDHVLVATRGLASIALGDLGRGTALYRRAAELADKKDRKGAQRSAMTQYQALALHELGVVDESSRELLRASTLPAVALPDDWRDRPEFLFLRFVARRNNLPWPVAQPWDHD